METDNSTQDSYYDIKNVMDHLMLQDFSYRVPQNFNEDIEFMELLKLELIFRCYKITNNLNKYQEELRLITYLLQKHSIDNYYIKLQSEYFLSHLAINQKISNFK